MSDLKFIHKTNLPVKERKMMWLFDLMDASFKKKCENETTAASAN